MARLPPGEPGRLLHSCKSRRMYSLPQTPQTQYKYPRIPAARSLRDDTGITITIMAMPRMLSKSAVRAASTSTASSQMTKAAGDISSVFPSLRPDYQPDPLPPRFKELKASLFERNSDALEQSWQRLLPSLEEEVQKIQAKGSDVCCTLLEHEMKDTNTYLLDHTVCELLGCCLW